MFRWKRCLERIDTQSLWKAVAEALSPCEQEGDDEFIALLDVLRKDRGVDGFSVDEEVDIAEQLTVFVQYTLFDAGELSNQIAEAFAH